MATAAMMSKTGPRKARATAPPAGAEGWIATPIGDVRVTVDQAGALVALEFGPQPTFGAGGEPGRPAGTAAAMAGLAEAARQLGEYFAGKRREFELPVATRGTAFQREVWSQLARIPYGRTLSYGELSRRLGRPGASRAVGAANGANPLPIVVPCHRVVAADGGLGGYSAGLEIKRRLLILEGAILA